MGALVATMPPASGRILVSELPELFGLIVTTSKTNVGPGCRARARARNASFMRTWTRQPREPFGLPRRSLGGGRSVRRRALDALDDEDLHGRLCRLQPQTESLLDGGEDRRQA